MNKSHRDDEFDPWLCQGVFQVCPYNEYVLDWINAKGFRLIDTNDQWVLFFIPTVCPYYYNGGCTHVSRPRVCRMGEGLYKPGLDKLGLTIRRPNDLNK